MARILVLDNDSAVLQLTKTLLDWQKHEVALARQPHQALELAHSVPFDLLIVEEKLPGFSGLEFVRSLRLLLGTSRPLPSLLMLLPEGASEAEREGFYLRIGLPVTLSLKPISPERLLERIAHALQRQG